MNVWTKFGLQGVVLIPLLLWFGTAPFWQVLLAIIALTLLTYLLGDEIILRSTNPLVATVVDGVFAFFFLWIIGFYGGWNLSVGELLIVSLALAAAEAWFHHKLTQTDRDTSKV